MKKIILSFLIMLMPMMAFSQNVVDGKHVVYIELLGSTNLFSTKVKVSVDLGQPSSEMFKLRDEDGKPLKFNTMVGVLNYMTQRGWEFVNAFPITHGNQNVYDFLLKKYVKDDKEITEGLKLEKDN